MQQPMNANQYQNMQQPGMSTNPYAPNIQQPEMSKDPYSYMQQPGINQQPND